MGEHKNEDYKALAQDIAKKIKTTLWPTRLRSSDKTSFTLAVVKSLQEGALAQYDDRLRKIKNPEKDSFIDALSMWLFRAILAEQPSSEDQTRTLEVNQAQWIVDVVGYYRDYLCLKQKAEVIVSVSNHPFSSNKKMSGGISSAISGPVNLSSFEAYLYEGYDNAVQTPRQKVIKFAMVVAGFIGFIAGSMAVGAASEGERGDYLFTRRYGELSGAEVFGLIVSPLFLIVLALAAKKFYAQNDTLDDNPQVQTASNSVSPN